MMSLLSGFLTNGKITDAEYKMILDNLVKVSILNEKAIDNAVAGVENGDDVASALKRQFLQQGLGPVPIPLPAGPVMAPAISANQVVATDAMSTQYPSVIDGINKNMGIGTSKVANAALKRLLKELDLEDTNEK